MLDEIARTPEDGWKSAPSWLGIILTKQALGSFQVQKDRIIERDRVNAAKNERPVDGPPSGHVLPARSRLHQGQQRFDSFEEGEAALALFEIDQPRHHHGGNNG